MNTEEQFETEIVDEESTGFDYQAFMDKAKRCIMGVAALLMSEKALAFYNVAWLKSMKLLQITSMAIVAVLITVFKEINNFAKEQQ